MRCPNAAALACTNEINIRKVVIFTINISLFTVPGGAQKLLVKFLYI
jgi:hypothetical protein